jgi:hypothetical protein
MAQKTQIHARNWYSLGPWVHVTTTTIHTCNYTLYIPGVSPAARWAETGMGAEVEGGVKFGRVTRDVVVGSETGIREAGTEVGGFSWARAPESSVRTAVVTRVANMPARLAGSCWGTVTQQTVPLQVGPRGL